MINNGVLGKEVIYKDTYDKNLLHPIPRELKRFELGINDHSIFHNGFDFWNCYEVSWLNTNNKPEVRIGEIVYRSDSPFIIESKSLKLYLNSFNNSNFITESDVISTITKDLSEVLQTNVVMELRSVDNIKPISAPLGLSLDHIDITIPKGFAINPKILETEKTFIEESVYSNLLKSNCLITNQPDWATIEISYSGYKINHAKLLQYIVSFRNHNEFHEQCVERIFSDILQICQPEKLSVYGKYTRRGGIDINPFRSTEKDFEIINARLVRQ